MSKIEKVINWVVTIATAIGTAITYIVAHMPK